MRSDKDIQAALDRLNEDTEIPVRRARRNPSATPPPQSGPRCHLCGSAMTRKSVNRRSDVVAFFGWASAVGGVATLIASGKTTGDTYEANMGAAIVMLLFAAWAAARRPVLRCSGCRATVDAS